ncbi:hypothetical protein [Actinoplanes sp. GCM10030250]|uniref:hypothetical protein n=1 Tax=Actinoplanes sp. GCM10030250 TaxID=3273376 RepID=UPI0036167C30
MSLSMKTLSGRSASESVENFPAFLVEFTEDEFQELMRDPVGTMRKLGHEVGHFTISLSDSIWLSSERRWIAGSEQPVRTRMRPVYVCGYSDSVCWCVRVL